MSEPKLISPLLDNFIMGDPISDRHGIRCCPAMPKDSDDKYIVKIISIPASKTKLDALLLSGAYPDESSCLAYFEELTGDLVKEINVLQKLSTQEGFVACEGYQVVPMEDGTGFDIYLLTKYRRSLERQALKTPATHLDALNLALDICSALTACRRSGYLYCDLKPGNIYITDNKEYRIGDLGFVSLSSLRYASLPEKYLNPYTAPEITDAFSALNTSMDIYALGAILYQLYSGGSLPVAVDGIIPVPQYADDEIQSIIMKAVDPDPANRWEDPAQMGQAFVSYMQRNGASNEPIVPPVIPEPDPVPDEITESETEESIDDILAGIDLDTEDAPEGAPAEENTEDRISEVITEDSQEDTAEDSDPVEIPLDAAPMPVSPAEPDATEPQPVSGDEFTDDIPSVTPDISEPKDTVYAEDENGNLSFIPSAEEVMPPSSTEPGDISEISDLNSTEKSDGSTPEDTLSKGDSQEDTATEEDGSDTNDEEILLSSVLEDIGSSNDDEQDQDEAEPEEDNVIVYDEETPRKPKKQGAKFVLLALLLILLLGAAFLAYRFYYLQKIDDLELYGTKDQLTVSVKTDIDNALLTVICENTDDGKSVEVPVVNGQAFFSGLLAEKDYKIRVKITGFHQLVGETTADYSSPDESAISEFTALTGDKNGTAVLNFQLDGPDATNWTVTYSAKGEEEKSVQFSGHTVTLSDLTVGAEYTVQLSPDIDLYLTGIQEVKFVASNVIQAEALYITSLKDGQLTAVWEVPENEIVEGWKVRCYNGTDYDKTITTNQATATFSDLDHTDGFTVEVSAIGQSITQTAQVGENAITLSEINADTSTTGMITLSWESTTVPEGGWIIEYLVEGMDLPLTAEAENNAFTLISALPGRDYQFTILAADSTPVVHAPITCTTEDAKNFQREYSGYTVTRNNFSFGMCRTPNDANWDYKDVPYSAYTRVFKPGQRASFVIFLNRKYGTSSEMIHTTFAFYNSDGKLIDICTSSRTWTDMWYKSYCEMDIPRLPLDAGSYNIRIYFNGEYVTNQSFSISE